MIRTFTIRDELAAECKKHIQRHGLSVALAKKQQRLFNNRTWLTPKKPTNGYAPPHWKIDNAFNPFYVRKRIPQIARAISKRIGEGSYTPKPSLQIPIPKAGGGTRTIAISTIADAAVSRWLYRRLLAKNLHRLSSYAFAYRPDRTIGHAIEHLKLFIEEHPRVFLVEYDFRGYFDSIDHDYLEDVLASRIRIGRRELQVAMSLVKSSYASENQYRSGHFTRRKNGIAQGSSLSLFLANLACIELDDALEKAGVCYARYADDTVVLCRSYDQACRAAEVLHTHKFRAGTELNMQKSEGICLLTEEPNPEFRSKQSFDFLGHAVQVDGVSIAEKTKRKIKNKVSKIIHRHLLLYPTKYDQISPNRVAGRIDWDLVTCVNELRRYISGTLTKEQLAGTSPIRSLSSNQGIVSFFTEITIGDVFRELDGWLVSALRRATAERRRRLWRWFEIQTPLLTRDELVRGTWYSGQTIENDASLPSFFNAWKALRRVTMSKGYGSAKTQAYAYSM